MTDEIEISDVVFRVGRSEIDVMNYRDDKAVIALFPGHAGTNDWWTCSAYVHVGQHTDATLPDIIYGTRPATPEEYAALKRELEGRGYVLKVVKRCTERHARARREQIAR